MRITPMAPEHARLISRWEYGGDYSFYNHSEDHIAGFLDGTHYACVDSSGELLGFFCFGGEARIPTVEKNVYSGDFLDMGLGLRPDLCGKKLGLAFVNAGLAFAAGAFPAKALRLSVACFNKRAVKVYQRAGFAAEREVTNSHFGNKFYVMKKALQGEK
jgi:RimJ/RimL family protein N-acetyltransferase